MMSFFKNLFRCRKKNTAEADELSHAGEECVEDASDNTAEQPHAADSPVTHNKSLSRAPENPSGPPKVHASHAYGTRSGTTAGHSTSSKPSIKTIPQGPIPFMGTEPENKDE